MIRTFAVHDGARVVYHWADCYLFMTFFLLYKITNIWMRVHRNLVYYYWNLKVFLGGVISHQFFFPILKGRRSVMPLARIAIQPPAGAARGQVWLESSSYFPPVQISFSLNIINVYKINSFCSPMTLLMKQKSFLESEITFIKRWLRKQDSLLKRYSVLVTQVLWSISIFMTKIC